METPGIYEWITESSAALFVFCSFYLLLFRKDAFFQWKRFFLLGAILFSAMLPFLHFSAEKTSFAPFILEPLQGNVQNMLQAETTSFSPLLKMIWITGVAISSGILIIRIIRLKKWMDKNKDTPYSFFHIVRTGKTNSDKEKEVIGFHESIHSKEWHSLDVILIELAKPVFWFNPLIYLAGKEIRFIHENIADTATSRVYPEYRQIMLNRQFNTKHFTLAHEFNPGLNLKNRFIMMNKKTKKTGLLKYVSVPIAAFLLVFTFSLQTNVSMAQEVVKNLDKQPQYETSTEKLYEELGKKIKYPEELKKEKAEAKVFVSMIISKEGEIVESNIINSTDQRFNSSALELVNSIDGRWKPGIKDGEPVRSEVILPINYKLDDKKKDGKK